MIASPLCSACSARPSALSSPLLSSRLSPRHVVDVSGVLVRVECIRSVALRDVRRAAAGRCGGGSDAQRTAVGMQRLHLRQRGQRRKVHHVHGRSTGGVRARTSGAAGTLHPEPVAIRRSRAHAPRRAFPLSLTLSCPCCPSCPVAVSVGSHDGSAWPGAGSGRCVGLVDAQ